MAIDLPISLDFTRPLTVPDTPYRQCGRCQHVAVPLPRSEHCSGCGGAPANGIWPEVELMELWHDEVFCWNHEKAEMATVIAAMYFEASTFMLLYWATCWLDPELNWLNAQFQDLREKEQRIQAYLDSLDSVAKTNAGLVRAFGVDGQQMLERVLGSDASPFWANYMQCRRWRNQIAHRGKRVFYETIPEDMRRQHQPARDQVLRASLQFVPECWAVFSKLWNEYIHGHMLARLQGKA